MPLFENHRSTSLPNTIPSTTAQHYIQQEEYKDAHDELAQMLNNRKVSTKMKTQLRKLLAKVEYLKASDSFHIINLTKVLTKTQDLLEHKIQPSDYKKIADNIYGNPSTGMKVIGAIMLAICAIAIGIALAAIAIPIATATATTMLLTGSVCFFSGGRHGLSEIMNNIVSEAEQSTALIR